MTDELRFPSGATMSQVKKDAKSIKRERNVSHSEALDAAAKQHGFNLPWNEVQSRLSSRGDLLELAFQCGINPTLTLQRPIGFILGPTGSGKTAIAAEICVNLLRAGGVVLNLIPDVLGYSTIPGFIADEMCQASSTVPGFKRHDVAKGQSLSDLLTELSPKPGTLVVMEEPQTLAGFDALTIYAACAKWQLGFVGVAQDNSVFEIVGGDRLSFFIDAEGLLASERHLHAGLWVKATWHATRLVPDGTNSVFEQFKLSPPFGVNWDDLTEQSQGIRIQLV